MTEQPIFIGITRSFWFTVIGFASLAGSGDEVLRSLGSLIGLLPWVDATEAGDMLIAIAPFVLWLAAMRERSGAARPYTLNPRALK